MTAHPLPGSDVALVDFLSELFFGDEQQEPLEDTLDRLVSPDFCQRINGAVHRRQEYANHVRMMRGTVSGGHVEVLEQVREGQTVAGRYLFRVVRSEGSAATFESGIFARLGADGRIDQMVEIGRLVEDGDNSDFLASP